jgi:16S rRNA (guanine966-N2)-methyltransferase
MKIVAGTYKHRKIVVPKSDVVRPTSERLRESLFDICQGMVEEATFLDLFAGSGAMGLEALSRGAKKATFIDSNRDSIRCIKQNIESLNVEKQTQVIMGDVFDFLGKLSKLGQTYDIIYADPPYDSWKTILGKPISFSQQLLKLIDEGTLLAPLGTLFIEESATAAPVDRDLQTLVQVSVRRMGRSILQEYQKKG